MLGRTPAMVCALAHEPPPNPGEQVMCRAAATAALAGSPGWRFRLSGIDRNASITTGTREPATVNARRVMKLRRSVCMGGLVGAGSRCLNDGRCA
jgi:hypothetical protein